MMLLIYETVHFSVEACPKPHVSRADGGHIIIFPKKPVVSRWDLDQTRAKALMRLSMMAGEAMTIALNERGIPVERINFMDCGNWAIGTRRGPRLHLHLYGRARDSVHQVHGEALHFPHKDTRFWEALEPLNEGDRNLIKRHLERLAQEDQYRLDTWGLNEG
jgi:diadenosine tetraphosphate (Ap4A) HIT family hydrolase